jgi:CelD/BcsL family acetyltransferase involved in cellulose biosynthesis
VSAAVLPLRFQIGARTLAAVPRRLHRVALSLDDVLSGHVPVLPALGDRDHGYLVTSLPETVELSAPGFVRVVRQRYERFHVDLAAGREAWLAGLSGSARSGLKRKRRKLADAGYAVRACHDPDAFAAFHPLARAISARTYQEKLLGHGLPDLTSLSARVAADRVRAWLLSVGEEPVAYLCCIADGATLRYDHVGHDPAWSGWSPGAVLQADAMDELFGDRFARFDFTEGEGQHKRQFASAGTPCVDLLLLRPTVANRVLVTALSGFDAAVARAKRSPWLARIGDKLRR